MKKALLTLLVLVAFVTIFAQNPVAKGQAQINAGIGLSSWGVPVYVGLDYGVHKDVTIGGEISHRSYRRKHHNHHYDHSVTGVSGNVNYHFNHVLNIPRNWDFYAGLNLGFYIWNDNDDWDDDWGDDNSNLGLGAQVGGRYYFSNTVGINLELGGNNAFSGGKLGLSFKL